MVHYCKQIKPQSKGHTKLATEDQPTKRNHNFQPINKNDLNQTLELPEYFTTYKIAHNSGLRLLLHAPDSPTSLTHRGPISIHIYKPHSSKIDPLNPLGQTQNSVRPLSKPLRCPSLPSTSYQLQYSLLTTY